MNIRFITVAVVIACTALLGPTTARADTASEIKALIESSNAYVKKNLSGQTGELSKLGSLEFWSSGGLLQNVSDASSVQKFKVFTLTPKHIQVITLVENQAAVALYYSEGAMQPEGNEAVTHYLTRITEVYVKEDGKWKTRSAHYSPITGGQGTSQTAVQ